MAFGLAKPLFSGFESGVRYRDVRLIRPINDLSVARVRWEPCRYGNVCGQVKRRRAMVAEVEVEARPVLISERHSLYRERFYRNPYRNTLDGAPTPLWSSHKLVRKMTVVRLRTLECHRIV